MNMNDWWRLSVPQYDVQSEHHDREGAIWVKRDRTQSFVPSVTRCEVTPWHYQFDFTEREYGLSRTSWFADVDLSFLWHHYLSYLTLIVCFIWDAWMLSSWNFTISLCNFGHLPVYENYTSELGCEFDKLCLLTRSVRDARKVYLHPYYSGYTTMTLLCYSCSGSFFCFVFYVKHLIKLLIEKIWRD